MPARVPPLPGPGPILRRGAIARSLPEVWAAVGLTGAPPDGPLTPQTAETVARGVLRQSGATHALAVLIDLDEGPDRIEFGGPICLAIATERDVASRKARILGGRV